MSDRPTSIIRADHGKDDPYFKMRRSTAQDKSLSWAARGMLAYLLSQPDDWLIKTKDLTQNCKRDKVYSILDELEKMRYLSREEVKDGEWANGRYRYLLYEEPYPLKPDTEKPATDESDSLHRRQEEQNIELTESDSSFVPQEESIAPADLAKKHGEAVKAINALVLAAKPKQEVEEYDRRLGELKTTSSEIVQVLEEKESKDGAPVANPPLRTSETGQHQGLIGPDESTDEITRSLMAEDQPPVSESQWAESQLTKGSRKNESPITEGTGGELKLNPPPGFKFLSGASSTEPIHLRRENQSLAAKPLCRAKVLYRLNPSGDMLRGRQRCEECWKIATTPAPAKVPRPPKKPQIWDGLVNEIGRVFFGAKDQAGVNAVIGRIAPILHGDKRNGRCGGILAYECERQGLERDALNFTELTTFVLRVWRFYQSKYPGKELKDCVKVLDNWQACRGLQVSPPQTKPRPVAHTKFSIDPLTGKDRGEWCDCAIGHNHDA